MATIQDEQALALLLLDDDEESDKVTRKRACWVQPWLGRRKKLGAYHTLFQEIKGDSKKCRDYIRMNNTQFLYLVDLQKKRDTDERMHSSIRATVYSFEIFSNR